MVLNKTNLTIILLLSVFSNLLAISSHQLYEQLVNRYNDMSSFQADINHTSYFADADYTNEAIGKIYFDKRYLHIAYQSPKEEIISLVDSLVYYYQVEEDVYIITYADSSFVSLNLENLIQKVWKDDLVNISEEDDYYKVDIELSEANSLANILNIDFKINKESNLVEEVKYLGDSGNSVTIVFSNIVLNDSPEGGPWSIETTENTQIIDYRN